MGGGASTAMPASAKKWHPDKLNAKLLRQEEPEFAGDLNEMRMQSLSAKISFRVKDTYVEEKLDNGGSETGAQIRRAVFRWKDPYFCEKPNQEQDEHPVSAIVKLTDVTEVPQMELLALKSWMMRHVVKYLMGGKGGDWIWDLIPRFILAERAVRVAAVKIARLDTLLTPLYFSRVRVGDFPSVNEWAKKGLGGIPSTWTLQAMAEIKKPYVSASGPTGMFKENDVSENVAKVILSGLARLHAACWGMGRECPLVKWITDRKPTASTLTLYYPMKFGLFPLGNELPDLTAPFANPSDSHFCKIDVGKFVSKLELGMKEVLTPYLSTIRQIQRVYPNITQQICHCSDGSDPDMRPSRFGRSQTILHGDAHAWNIFWDLNAKDPEQRVKLIDMTNLGQGRVSWEVYYFIIQSFNCTCWLQLHRVLQHYYAELVVNLSPCRRAVDGEKWSKRPEEGDNLRIQGNDRQNMLSTMPYHAFLREFYLLAIVHTTHWLAQLNRWGRFTGKGAAKFRNEMKGDTVKARRKRRECHYNLLHAERYMWLASEIFKRVPEAVEVDVVMEHQDAGVLRVPTRRHLSFRDD